MEKATLIVRQPGSALVRIRTLGFRVQPRSRLQQPPGIPMRLTVTHRLPRLALAASTALSLPAVANHGGPVTGAPQVIIIQGGHYDNAVGTQDAASAGTIRRELLQSRPAQRPGEVLVAVAADGRYAINKKPVDGRSIELLTAELVAASGGRADTVVIISADALAAHQSVVNVLDAARRAGLARLTFAAQSSTAAPR